MTPLDATLAELAEESESAANSRAKVNSAAALSTRRYMTIKVAVGDRYGRWLVTGDYLPGTKTTQAHVGVTCDCGASRVVRVGRLRSGASRSCGCLSREVTASIRRGRPGPVPHNGANAVLNEIGNRYGSLTVIDCGNRRGREIHWWCRCVCGDLTETSGHSLRSGRTNSCGCKGTGYTKAQLRMPEYHIWTHMLVRCGNPRATRYHRYGGRGIVVCDEWRRRGGFTAFFAHVGARPSEAHSIDRINNDGNYEPGNVRWATPKEQANNKSTNLYVDIGGERASLAVWVRRVGAKYAVVRGRLARGQSPARALRECGDPSLVAALRALDGES